MGIQSIAAYLNNVRRKRWNFPPAPPAGFQYVVDEFGHYVRDLNGKPTLEPVPDP